MEIASGSKDKQIIVWNLKLEVESMPEGLTGGITELIQMKDG
jgi:hypothetical protein